MIRRPCAADVQKATQFLSKHSAAAIANTNGRKLGVYITSTSCTCTDARCWWSRLKLGTSAPGLRHSEEARADSH